VTALPSGAPVPATRRYRSRDQRPVRDPLADHLLIPETQRSCSLTTSPPSWPPSSRWIRHSCSRTPSRRSGPSRPSGPGRTLDRQRRLRPGPTLSELAGLLAEGKPLNRTTVNCWEDIEFVQAVRAAGRRKLIICTLWTEVRVAFLPRIGMRRNSRWRTGCSTRPGMATCSCTSILISPTSLGRSPMGSGGRRIPWATTSTSA
jgi:hypothetical protein